MSTRNINEYNLPLGFFRRVKIQKNIQIAGFLAPNHPAARDIRESVSLIFITCTMRDSAVWS